MKKNGRLSKKVATGKAKGETKNEVPELPEDDGSRLIKEMMDPFWASRFMRTNGYGR